MQGELLSVDAYLDTTTSLEKVPLMDVPEELKRKK